MSKVTIDQNRCKGCGLCVNACPKQVLCMSADQINAKGYNIAVAESPENCIGCAMCAIMCPDIAITVEK